MTIPAIMKSLVAFFDDRSPLFWTIIGIVLVGLLGIIDYLTGYEISFSLFYLAPIAAVAWYASRKLGIFISILSALTWMLAELSSGQTYSQPVIYFWNTLIRLGFFMIVTYLVSALRSAHEVQRTLARTDPISGAVNARYFNELVQMEIARSSRSLCPFSIAYI